MDTALVSVVDDDESVRESLPDLLRSFGYAAQAFASGEDFLASDVLGRTQCLVLDVAMPGMSGPDLKRDFERRRRFFSKRVQYLGRAHRVRIPNPA